MNKNEMIKDLSKPFPAEAIDWRVGATNADKSKGIALAYLQARPVMDRLDEVVGPENWQDAYTPIQGPNGLAGFICTLSLKIGDDWVSKTDGSDTSDVEPIKGGFSDSFKRAAVKWGIGRYLYDLPNTWYPIEPKGKSHVLKTTPTLPSWALPSGKSMKPTAPTTSEPKKTNEPEVEMSSLTIEEAYKVTGSKGDLYYKQTTPALQKIMENLNKQLALNDLTDEALGHIQHKLDAAKLILQERANGSVA